MNTANINLSKLSRLDLPRLWPTLSTTLYPETEQRFRIVMKEVDESGANAPRDEEWSAMIEAVTTLERMVGQHYKQTASLINDRLQAAPYGTKEFGENYFSDACRQQDISGTEIKKQWRHVRSIARRRLSKTLSSSENKLAYARLNSVEQDVLYVLYVEQHYLWPLICKRNQEV